LLPGGAGSIFHPLTIELQREKISNLNAGSGSAWCKLALARSHPATGAPRLSDAGQKGGEAARVMKTLIAPLQRAGL